MSSRLGGAGASPMAAAEPHLAESLEPRMRELSPEIAAADRCEGIRRIACSNDVAELRYSGGRSLGSSSLSTLRITPPARNAMSTATATSEISVA